MSCLLVNQQTMAPQLALSSEQGLARSADLGWTVRLQLDKTALRMRVLLVAKPWSSIVAGSASSERVLISHPDLAHVTLRVWLIGKTAGATSVERTHANASIGGLEPARRVGPLVHLPSRSVLHRGHVDDDRSAVVDLPQGVGRHFSMAGAAASRACVALRAASSVACRLGSASGTADRAPICLCAPRA
jgi:hypothetical protein